MPNIAVEFADAARFSACLPQWLDLTRRAAEPNGFMEPEFVAASAASAGAGAILVLLAWRETQLMGVWTLRRHRPKSGLPVAILTAPVHEAGSDSTPVIDRDHVSEVMAAMISAVATNPGWPKMLSLELFNESGPVMSALSQIAARQNSPIRTVQQFVRPYLTGGQSPEAYFAEAMSSSRRRKLGQLRRKLAGRGVLELVVHRSRGSVAAALERQIALEAEGWKAKYGRTLHKTGDLGHFVRAAIPAMAARGAAEIWEMTLNGAPISMALVMRHGHGVFDWLVTYDETHGDCSPGVLLAIDYTTDFLSDSNVAYADSCAQTDTGLLGPLWTGRHRMANIILDVRPGGSLAFSTWAAWETAYRRARQAGKGPFHAMRTRLRKLTRR